MTRSQAASMPQHFTNYKHLTVDDVLPSSTSLLYKRLFSLNKKRNIPVRDASEKDATLNAYLIDPAFLDKSVAISDVQRPTSPVRAVQYSQLGAMRSTLLPLSNDAQQTMADRIQTASSSVSALLLGSKQLVKTVSPQLVKTKYTVEGGAISWWKRNLFMKVGATMAVAGGVVFASAMQPDKVPLQPVATPNTNSVSNERTSTVTMPVGADNGQGIIAPTSATSGRSTAAGIMPSPAAANPSAATDVIAPITELGRGGAAEVPPTPVVEPTPEPTPTPVVPPVENPIDDGLGGTVNNVVGGASDTVGGLIE